MFREGIVERYGDGGRRTSLPVQVWTAACKLQRIPDTTDIFVTFKPSCTLGVSLTHKFLSFTVWSPTSLSSRFSLTRATCSSLGTQHWAPYTLPFVCHTIHHRVLTVFVASCCTVTSVDIKYCAILVPALPPSSPCCITNKEHHPDSPTAFPIRLLIVDPSPSRWSPI